jgi:DNA-binding XRE family transcriptional regulator
MASRNSQYLRGIRKALGKNQGEFAALLGMSKRAVQSYEQGWRPVPDHIVKCAALLVFLKWRKAHRKQAACWDILKCPAAVRSRCRVYEFAAGDLCWLLIGCRCEVKAKRARRDPLAGCRECEVMQQWLKGAVRVTAETSGRKKVRKQ